MSASKSKIFAYSSLALIIFLSLAPLTSVGAKTITIGTSASDIVEIPGLLVNTSLTGAGNRCLYVDGNNQLSVKGFDCGSSTGGDNLGDHSATQNLRLNSFWLSGDGGNEGIQIGSTGNMTTSGTVSFTGVVYAGGGNRMITVDNAGVLGAASLPTSLPTGTTNYTLRYDGSSWVSNGNLYNNGTNVGIGTVNPGSKLTINGGNDKDTGPILNLSGNAANQFESGRVRFTETSVAAAPYYQGAYFHYDGASNIFNIGVHPTSDAIQGNDVNSISIVRSSSYVGINTTAAGARLQVNGSAGVEALRLVTASDYSPLNIRNSGNTADIFRVDQTGSLAAGTVPWARLASYPAACSAGQYVTAVGGTLTCAAPAASTDIYWTGTATNLVPATARTSLGLGSLATLSTVANAQITDMAWSKLTGFPAACSAGQYVTAVGGTLTCSTPAGGVSGSGTTNMVSKWTGTSAQGNSTIYDNGTSVGINTTSPSAANVQINAASTLEALRLVSAASYSPLNIRNSGNTADIFRVDQTGSLAAGTVPWARLASYPAACSAGQYVTAVGGTLTCATPAAGADIYWTGTATNLVPATGRASLGLGSLATLSSVGNAQITDVAWSKITGFPAACSAGQYVTTVGGTLTCSTPASGSDIYWTGTATNLVASTARTSLGLGALATLGAVSGGTGGTITDATITNADISASAAIASSKIQNGTYFITSAGTSGQVWTSDGSGAGIWAAGGGGGGVGGSGSAGMLAYWADSTNLESSPVYFNRENIGIDTTSPNAKLHVNGSLLANSSVTFSLLGGGGTRAVTVDNAGNLGATTMPSGGLPSGTSAQTLRNNGLGSWVANSLLTNDGSTVKVNYAGNFCDTDTKLLVSGQVMTPSVYFSQPVNLQCTPGAYIKYIPVSGNLAATGATTYTFDSNMNVSGIVTGASFRVGFNTGISGTVAVRNSTNTGSCNLVFSGGILVSETCP